MGSDFEDSIKKTEHLDLEVETATKEKSLAELKKAEREAKATYGKDWKKILFGAVKSIKPNMETVHDLYGSGLGDLKDMNNPSKMRIRK